MAIGYAFQNKRCLLLGIFLLASNIAQAQLTPRTTSSLATQTDSPQPLPLEQAFPFYVSAISPEHYKITWELADGHYLYRHAFKFSLSQFAESAELPIDATIPNGLKKNDQFFGDIEAYYDQLEIDLNLDAAPKLGAKIFIHYQGCADWGFCYPPQRIAFLLNP